MKKFKVMTSIAKNTTWGESGGSGSNLRSIIMSTRSWDLGTRT